jgi:hypothetical protein
MAKKIALLFTGRGAQSPGWGAIWRSSFRWRRICFGNRTKRRKLSEISRWPGTLTRDGGNHFARTEMPSV